MGLARNFPSFLMNNRTKTEKQNFVETHLRLCIECGWVDPNSVEHYYVLSQAERSNGRTLNAHTLCFRMYDYHFVMLPLRIDLASIVRTILYFSGPLDLDPTNEFKLIIN